MVIAEPFLRGTALAATIRRIAVMHKKQFVIGG